VVRRFPTAYDNPSDSDTELSVHFVDYSTDEEDQDVDFGFCTGHFSEEHTV